PAARSPEGRDGPQNSVSSSVCPWFKRHGRSMTPAGIVLLHREYGKAAPLLQACPAAESGAALRDFFKKSRQTGYIIDQKSQGTPSRSHECPVRDELRGNAEGEA